jgi:prevent-host-death family protein
VGRTPSPFCLSGSLHVLDFATVRPYAGVTLVTTKEALVKFTNVRELKAKTSEMLRTVERGNTVLVTTHGRPTAMLVPVTEDDIEDALLAYSPTLRKKIEEGLKDIRAGRTMALSDYKTKRNRKRVQRA